MAKNFTDSLSNSLKGKIWLSTTALAFFVCAFGSLAYIVVSYLINDPIYAVFIPFLFLSIVIVAFGLWLANEITNPVERVLLLAKSLERGVTTGLPKTSGALETDELLETIQRINQQTHKLVGAMEDVAQGNFAAVESQNLGSDRIGAAFQKLLAKVSESIRAKRDLDKLKNALSTLSGEAAAFKNNNLNVKISVSNNSTKEIALVLNTLTEQFNELLLQIKNSASQSQTSSIEIGKTMQNFIEQNENRAQEMTQATFVLNQVPQFVKKISEELTQSASSANQAIEKAHQGMQNSQVNILAVNQLRRQIQESVKHIQKLGEYSSEIGKVGKTIGDLAQRTNLVALNASIQAAEIGEQGRSFAVVAEEVERLAERSNRLTNQIAGLAQTIQVETKDVVASMEETIHEVVVGSTLADKAGQALIEIEQVSRRLAELIQSISASADRQARSSEDISKAMGNISKVTELVNSGSKRAADSVKMLVLLSDELRGSVAPFKLPDERNQRLRNSAESSEIYLN